VFYRGLYAERGPQDQRAVISVASAIGAAEMRMRLLRIREACTGDSPPADGGIGHAWA